MNGFWCIYGTRFSEKPFLPRHLVPMAFVAVLMVSFLSGLFFKPALWLAFNIAGLYLAAMLIASLALASKQGLRYLPFFMAVFPSIHFSYGVGSLCGAWQLMFPEKK